MMTTLESDTLIVGAGVVGVAVAAELAREGREVVVVEREGDAGRITSSRNSGVVHAGIYYPEGSLKAESCVLGRALLYERAARLGIPHEKCGKLVVATRAEEEESLAQLEERAGVLGVPLVAWDRATLAAREPLLRGTAALFSPESGIVDAHALVESYRAEATAGGAAFAYHTEIVGIDRRAPGYRATTTNRRGERISIAVRHIVDAAGLDADRVAELAGLDVDALGLRQHPCKGDYFALASVAPRPRTALVYPVPSGPGLGIHLTTDLGGRRIAGPDATYVDRIDYAVDPAKATAFAEAVSRYLPGVGPEHLTPDQSGIRPKLARAGEPFRDFVVLDAAPHGAPGVVILAGIESPGLTASGALARRVASLLRAHG
jgi:L-2-hydroxyglutarate oxidase LhgO